VSSFANPCFTEAELDNARSLTRGKRLGEPLRLLFAGRLRPSKGAARALHVLDELRRRGFDARLDIAGDGPEAANLEQLAARLGIRAKVNFHGWLSREALEELYREAHFFCCLQRPKGGRKFWGKRWLSAPFPWPPRSRASLRSSAVVSLGLLSPSMTPNASRLKSRNLRATRPRGAVWPTTDKAPLPSSPTRRMWNAYAEF
jgi:GNAT superfamily N-acetyltransferase